MYVYVSTVYVCICMYMANPKYIWGIQPEGFYYSVKGRLVLAQVGCLVAWWSGICCA
jgi:hypothetical protein